MEDFMFSMHMMRRVGIGYVAIYLKDQEGNITFKKTKTKVKKGIKENSLVQFSSGGTGFIISTKTIEVEQQLVQFALLLTAGHVVCNCETLLPHSDFFTCCFENGEISEAYLIKAFMNIYPDELESHITNAAYCLPGDLAILLVDVKLGIANPYELATINDIKVNASCIVSGYPCRPSDLEYCLPMLFGSKNELIENEASSIFCGFNKKVYAKGKIECDSNKLVEISCSTACGMSGGPVISQEKVIGVYVGGPPIPGQRECMKIIQRLSNKENPLEIVQNIRELAIFDSYFSTSIFNQLIHYPSFKNFEIAAKVLAGKNLNRNEKKIAFGIEDFTPMLNINAKLLKSALYEMIYFAVVVFKNKESLLANVGMPVGNRALNHDIPNIINRFLDIRKVDKMQNIVEYLSA